MKKTLIKNEQEYRSHVFKYLNADSIDIWEGFDMEKLNKAFKLMDGGRTGKMSDEESELINYYLECLESSDHLDRVEFRDNLSGIDIETLTSNFGVIWSSECYDYDDDGNEIDEDGNIMSNTLESPEALVFEDWAKELSYPFVIVSWISSGFDRLGSISFCAIEFVELKEFGL